MKKNPKKPNYGRQKPGYTEEQKARSLKNSIRKKKDREYFFKMIFG